MAPSRGPFFCRARTSARSDLSGCALGRPNFRRTLSSSKGDGAAPYWRPPLHGKRVSMSSGVMPGLDSATGMFSLPWWVAAVLAAFMVACFILALARTGLAGLLTIVGGVVVLVFALSSVWTWSDVTMRRDRAEERRALETRAFELSGRAVTQGLALACLDGAAGEAVEASCEKALFANAETLAA